MAADRVRQVNELLHRAIAEIIQKEIELPLGSFITITGVSTAPDLKYATIFVTILPNHLRGSTFEFLGRKTIFIQNHLAGKVKLQFVPRLTFELDEGEIRAQRIYELLDTPEDKD
ncbi:MAG: ribosome-binding factor A [Candidatus Kerfeldbacteria bacterium]|nr:ribosome-binding factor A [Candidatus Kerfeldbacteria bacterium]